MRRTTRSAAKLLARSEVCNDDLPSTTATVTKRRRKAAPNKNTLNTSTNAATSVLDETDVDIEVLRADKDLVDHPMDSSLPNEDFVTVSDDDDGVNFIESKGGQTKTSSNRRGGGGCQAGIAAARSKRSVPSTDLPPMLDVIDVSSGTSSGSSSPSVVFEVASCSSISTSSPKRSSSQSQSEHSSPAKSAAEPSTSKSVLNWKKSKRDEKFTGIIKGAQRKLKKRTNNLSAEEILKLNMTDSIGASTLASTIKPTKPKKVEPYDFKRALDKLVPDEDIQDAIPTYQSELDRPLTKRQAEIADLDTDTELESDGEEEPAGTKNLTTKSQLNVIKQQSPSKPRNRLDDLNNEYANFQENLQSSKARRRQPATPGECIVIDNYNSSPVIPEPSPRAAAKDSKWDHGLMRIHIFCRDVRYNIDCSKDWDVLKLRKQFSEMIGEPVKRVHIYSKGDELMRDGKTLGSYKIEVYDVLEASIHNASETVVELPEEDAVKLTFQKEKKRFVLKVAKSSTFAEIQQQVAKELKLGNATIRFKFDNEYFDLTQTPQSLELEDDDMIDVHGC